MKPFIIGTFLIIIIGIIIGIVVYKTSNSYKLKQIDKYTKELFTIITSMANAKCVTPAIKSLNDSIISNNNDAQTIISQLASSGKAATPASISAYNDAYKKYQDIYSKLTDCSAYCFQGDISSGNCICPPNYPIPIQVGDKIYCTNEDCTKIPNATFIPSTSSDPSTNKCECVSGYTKDPNGGSYCYSNDVTNKLSAYTTNLNNIMTTFSTLSPPNVYGTYKNTNGSLYIATASDAPPCSVPVSTSYKLSSTQCADSCLQDSNINAFTFDGSTQVCTLYSTSPTIILNSSINGSKVVGTKNTDTVSKFIQYTQTQTTPITIPSNVKSISIIVVGGGGGGARGGGWHWTNIGGGGGGGGGSGEVIKNTISLDSTLAPYSFTINIGEGGLQENDGKNTDFILKNSSSSQTITALGGKQGTKGNIEGGNGIGGSGGGSSSTVGKGQDGTPYKDRNGTPGDGGNGGIADPNIQNGRGGVGGQGLRSQGWVGSNGVWENPNGGRQNYLDPATGPFTGPLPGTKGTVIITFNT
jgi:hypothetical protein